MVVKPHNREMQLVVFLSNMCRPVNHSKWPQHSLLAVYKQEPVLYVII